MYLHREVEAYLRKTGMAPTAFGRAAASDPRLVTDMRAGRELRPSTRDRVRAYLAAPTYDPTLRKPPKVWTEDRKRQLWSMVEQGLPRKNIADALGMEVSPIVSQIHKMAEELIPHRPERMRLADVLHAMKRDGAEGLA